jgi:hypothetical protein
MKNALCISFLLCAVLAFIPRVTARDWVAAIWIFNAACWCVSWRIASRNA